MFRHKIIILFILVLVSGRAQKPAGNYLKQIKIWQQKPDSFDKFNNLGKIYQEIGNFKNAISFYNKALQSKYNIKTQTALAKAYQSYGKYRKAIDIWKLLVAKDSTNLTAQYRLANLYAKTGNQTKAMQLLHLLENKDPKNPNYPYKIGLFSDDIGSKKTAFLRAYQKDSTHINSIYQLGKIFRLLKAYRKMDFYLEKGLILSPNNTKFLQLKALSVNRKKDYKKVLYYTQKLDSLHYDRVFVYLNYGLAYIMLNQPGKAERFLRQVQTLDANNPVTYYYLGLLETKRKHYKTAQKYYRESIRLKQPDLNKEYYHLGKIYKKQNQLKTALKYFEKAYQNNKNNYKALYETALLHDALNHYEKALVLYQKYLDKFEHKIPFYSAFAKQQIKNLKETIFLNKK